MQIKTIVNRVEKHPGFVVGRVRWADEAPQLTLAIEMRADRRSQPCCSRCGRHGRVYDRLRPRPWQCPPLWGILVVLVYAMRRVDCPVCGVVVERVPWGEGKSPMTTSYAWFLAGWAKRLSWREVATVFHTSWDSVYRAVKMAVVWGRKHLELEDIQAIGFDEIQRQRRGNRWVTLVYQIDPGAKRLLWVGQGRTKKTARGFFNWFGRRRATALRFICSDMWQAYLTVAAAKAGQAVHILDRFHVMQLFNKQIDQVRRAEVRELKRAGRPAFLTNARWVLLRRRANRTPTDRGRLRELLRHNLKSVRAMLLREDFQPFWKYRSAFWAGEFLDRWCTEAMASRLEPIKRVARTLRKHRPYLINWFRARGQLSAGAVEGLNNKAKLTIRKGYGFRSFHCLRIALYHTLGDLPEPEFTHKFF
jgi:transposase